METPDFNVNQIILSIKSLTSPDKQTQDAANEYLFSFSHSPSLNLSIIDALLASTDPSVQHYTSVMLYTKTKNNLRELSPKDQSDFEEYLNNCCQKFSSNRVILDNLLKSLALLIMLKFENKDFSFVEANLAENKGDKRYFFMMFNHFCDILQLSLFPKKHKRMISTNFKLLSPKIISCINCYLGQTDYTDVLLALVDNLTSIRFDFFVDTLFIENYLKTAVKEKEGEHESVFEKFNTTLEKMIEGCQQARIMEMANLPYYLNNHKEPLLLLSQGVVDPENKDLSIFNSFVKLIQYIDYLRVGFFRSHCILLSLFVECFSQLLLFDSVIYKSIITLIEHGLKEFNEGNIENYLFFEWLPDFFGVLQSEEGNVSKEVLVYWKNFSVYSINSFLEKNKLKNESELGFYKLVNFNKVEESDDEVFDLFKERRENNAHLLIYFVKMLQVCDKDNFEGNLENIVRPYIVLENAENVQDYQLKLESLLFFVNNNLSFFCFKDRLKKFLLELLGFLTTLDYKNSELLFMGLVVCVYGLTFESRSDELDQFILAFIGDNFKTEKIMLYSNHMSESLRNVTYTINPNIITEVLLKTIADFALHFVNIGFTSLITPRHIQQFPVIFNDIVGSLLKLTKMKKGMDGVITDFLELLNKTMNNFPVTDKNAIVHIEVVYSLVEGLDVDTEEESVSLSRKATLLFITPRLTPIFDNLSNFLSNDKYKKKVYFLLRKLISNCGIEEVNYFPVVITLLRSQEGNALREDPKSLKIFSHLLSKNNESELVQNLIKTEFIGIDQMLFPLASFVDPQTGQRKLSKNESFETEYIKFIKGVLFDFETSPDFFAVYINKLDYLRFLLKTSHLLELKREIMKL